MEENKVTQTRIVLPGDTNAHNTLFGGKLMSYIDDVSAIAAVKYARRLFVTGSTDSVDFLHPINSGNSVTLQAYVTGAGDKSLEVFCQISGEDLGTGKKYLAATAFTTFVVVDGKPESIKAFVPKTPEEILVNKGYVERKKVRAARRSQNREFIEALVEL